MPTDSYQWRARAVASWPRFCLPSRDACGTRWKEDWSSWLTSCRIAFSFRSTRGMQSPRPFLQCEPGLFNANKNHGTLWLPVATHAVACMHTLPASLFGLELSLTQLLNNSQSQKNIIRPFNVPSTKLCCVLYPIANESSFLVIQKWVL